MRTIVEIPENLIQSLDSLGKQENQSRAAIIREAICEYLVHKRPQTQQEAFGLWKERELDGLSYQQRLRSEWE